MALPTKEEQSLIETFRIKVADILTDEQTKDDMFLVRWIRARDLNVDKAVDMLQTAVKWRKENGLDDQVIKEPMDAFYYENYPCYIDGMDKEGRPVYTCDIGKWDVRKVVREGKCQEFLSYLTERYEEITRAIRKSSEMHPPAEEGMPPITQIRSVFNWDGFAWSQLFSFQTVQTFLQLGALYETYYPEMLHSSYFINSPALISTVMKLLKPVMAPKTMGKITVMGTNSEEWKTAILEVIDEDQIRSRFGGTKEENGINPFL